MFSSEQVHLQSSNGSDLIILWRFVSWCVQSSMELYFGSWQITTCWFLNRLLMTERILEEPVTDNTDNFKVTRELVLFKNCYDSISCNNSQAGIRYLIWVMEEVGLLGVTLHGLLLGCGLCCVRWAGLCLHWHYHGEYQQCNSRGALYISGQFLGEQPPPLGLIFSEASPGFPPILFLPSSLSLTLASPSPPVSPSLQPSPPSSRPSGEKCSLDERVTLGIECHSRGRYSQQHTHLRPLPRIPTLKELMLMSEERIEMYIRNTSPFIQISKSSQRLGGDMGV